MAMYLSVGDGIDYNYFYLDMKLYHSGLFVCGRCMVEVSIELGLACFLTEGR